MVSLKLDRKEKFVSEVNEGTDWDWFPLVFNSNK